ncbi:MAG: Hsp20 family protein [Sphingorhabdus sp.]|nr:Hsp20 family protein [Sphingorhabdus sp.]
MRLDFAPYRRTTVGFDHLFELLENAGRTTQNENYPPFNIERVGENDYVVTVAVAGFKSDEIEITAQQNMLIVAGRKQQDGEEAREFLHMGIASRNFERRFQLSDYILVTGADLADGLLKINLLREIPEALKPRKIEIGTKAGANVIEHKPSKKAANAEKAA